MEEGFRYGSYSTPEAALEAAESIALETIIDELGNGRTLNEAKGIWMLYGEDPVIRAEGTEVEPDFSAARFISSLTDEDIKSMKNDEIESTIIPAF